MSDPTSVNTTYIQTLLENLRNSQTWVAAVGSSNSDASDVPVPEQYPTGLDTTPSFTEDRGHDSGADDRNKSSVPALGSSERPSVASLLSQLQASPISSLLSPVANPISTSADSQLHTLPESSAAPAGPLSTQSPAVASSHRQKDFRAFTFQQALLHLGELGKEKSFIEAINSMKAEQDDLERKLWEERQEIIHRHEKKVNGAKAKAQIVGVGLSKHDAEMLSNSIQRELQAFDIERVLPAWDGLTSKHQAAMEVLTVPSMFITSQASDLQKQQKIIQVLENIAMGGT